MQATPSARDPRDPHDAGGTAGAADRRDPRPDPPAVVTGSGGDGWAALPERVVGPVTPSGPGPARRRRRWPERRAPIGPPGRSLAAAVGLTGLVALAWFGMISRIGHFDVDVFLRAGAAVRAGQDPYPTPGTAAVHSGFAFVYPYLTALPFAPLSGLRHADDVFVALSVLAVLAGARLAGARDWRVFALVIAASTTIIGLQMGTLNALLFAGLTLAWRRRDRPATCGTVLALLVYSKVFLLPLLLWPVLARRWRAAAVAGVVLAVLLGAGELLSPLGTRGYLDLLGQLGRAESVAGVSLTGLLANVGLPMGVAAGLARAAAVAVLAGCGWALRRRGHDERLAYTGGVVAAVLASPIVWCHYLLLLVAPLLALSRPSGPGRPVGVADADAVADPDGVRGPRRRRRGRPVGANRPEGPVSPVPIATFAAASWFLVTPHRSSGAALAVTALILAPLVVSCLVSGGAPGPFGDRRRPMVPRVTLVASTTAGIGLVVAVGDGLAELAAVHTPGAHVVGAYAAVVGILALLAWAVRTTAVSWSPVGVVALDGPITPATGREADGGPANTEDSGAARRGTGGS
ncbi:conserved membrane hypothetical protein [Frankia canadensis]|uniref:DUF2029 domain-containing protein n=1 Tax=Frankia canadensis TaxID=1836972 RepID=A0A2I2KJZ6_9ACTN|nr:glycosyltransferase 87 family protein [Frankia canadensis]SNQ45991.1 conserved membrane hypothetical protein [Frankia canadensis]SOU53281.1 conserved membrane hypothetical protein [Frankia canadensis]